MKPLDSHPRDRREYEVVDECRQDGTRYQLDLGMLELRVESHDDQEGGVYTKESDAQTDKDPVCLAAPNSSIDSKEYNL